MSYGRTGRKVAHDENEAQVNRGGVVVVVKVKLTVGLAILYHGGIIAGTSLFFL